MFTLTEKKQSPEIRKTFVAVLEEMMDADSRVIALEADLGNASGFSKLQKTHPGQEYESRRQQLPCRMIRASNAHRHFF